jgi:hypothetical protein
LTICYPSEHTITHKTVENPDPTLRDAVHALGLKFKASRFGRWNACRLALPYGRWTCDDGREVLFNRRYHPIWQRRPGAAVERANPDEWVQWVDQQWFYGGAGGLLPPIHSRATLKYLLKVLSEFGVQLGAAE